MTHHERARACLDGVHVHHESIRDLSLLRLEYRIAAALAAVERETYEAVAAQMETDNPEWLSGWAAWCRAKAEEVKG